MSTLWWGLTAVKFSFTWVRLKLVLTPQISKEKVYFFHILGLNLKIPQGPLNSPKYTFFKNILAHVWKTGFQIISSYCTYVSIVMRAAFADISVPLIPRDFMYGPSMTPKKIKNNIFF